MGVTPAGSWGFWEEQWVGWPWDRGLVAATVLVVSLCFKHEAWPFKENLGLLYKGHIYYGDTTLYTKYL